MNPNDEPDYERIDQEIRINELKCQAEELAGGEMTTFEADDAPPNLVEGVWGPVGGYESAPDTSQYEQLLRTGIELPEPGTMDDNALHAKLWELIRVLASQNTYLER